MKKPYIHALFTINETQDNLFILQNTANLHTLYIHTLWEEIRGLTTDRN